jgi:hypothetical protein
MSASIFHSEWYTNPPWERVSLWWLINYVDNIRTNPGVLDRIKANKTEFEMVPVPVSVIRNLASEDVDRGSLPAQRRVDTKPVIELVERFASALEKGDVNAAMKTVSKSYFDINGRDRKALEGDLQQVTRDVSNVSVQTTKPDEVEQVGDQVVATVAVTWSDDQRRDETTNVELFLSRGPRKSWQIESMRTI